MVKDIDKHLSNAIFKVETKFAYDTLPWGDALYIRKTLLDKKRLLASHVKKFIYSIEILYKIFIFTRENCDIKSSSN